MKKLNFTAIDFETATSSRNSICQIGICRFENGVLVFSDSFLVQPPNNNYQHWNICIHGISSNITIDKPFFPEIWESIKVFFENELIVAHNASFDTDCLFKTLDFYNIEHPSILTECTYELTGLNLVDLAESLEIPLYAHHDAKYDSIVCAESYIKLKNGQIPNLGKVTNKEINSIFNGRKLHGDVLKPDLKGADSNSFFYGKKIVFTGVMDGIDREEAATITKLMGADVDTAISKKTNFVIIGKGAGPSKLNKVNIYNNSGSNIKLIYEIEFLNIIKIYKSINME